MALIAEGTESLRQKCDNFDNVGRQANTHDRPKRTYYTCSIIGNLTNDQEEVTTDTSLNAQSNAEVTAVQYFSSETVKFIPNSLFETFVNLEYLFISFDNKFETMKREYLQNANKLKNIWIYDNLIQKIDGNVFSEAKNLEHINFESNQIESVHKEAFSGLPNLKGVYLQGNKIKRLHPETFSLIANLNILKLSGCANCVNETFTSTNQKFPEIEAKISSGCTYELLPDEVLAIQKLAEENQIKIQEFNDEIGNLVAVSQAVSHANQEKFKEMTNKLEKMQSEMSSQQEKRLVNLQKQFDIKIADQQKEFKAKIASEKLQMETKYNQLEAKLATQQKECKSELQLEFTNHKNEIETTITKMKAKLTAQKLELLQECKSETLQEIIKHNIKQNLAFVKRINDQKDSNKKYSDEIETTCENNLRLVQSRLTNLENKDD